MSNKRLLGEQVLYRLEAGYPDKFNIQLDDIYKAIEQKINALFRMEHFSVTLPSGESVPDYATMAFYEDIAVTSVSNGRSQCKLPVAPITLPRNMGIYEIQDPEGKVSFIPLLQTQRMLLKSQPLISDLLMQVGYTPMGKVIEFSKDLPLFKVKKVNMVLIVMDLSKYDELDELPIPISYEETIVTQLFNEFAGVEAKADVKLAKAG